MFIVNRKYNTAATIDGLVLLTKGTDTIKTTPTLATGDAKIYKDGGAGANLATLPAETPASSGSVRIALSATELSCARAVIKLHDQTSPAEWADQILIVETYGNASANLIPDYNDAVRLGLTSLPNANAEAAGGLYTRGAGAGQINQSSNGQVDVNAVAVSGDSTAADNAEAFFDGTGYAGGTIPLAVNTTQFAGQTITCAGGVTIPAATLASTTNITGGTLTTVTTATNLTNAPTNGDLTATMKTSIQTELSTYGALRPTVAGRTLDVTAAGNAGIDWGNVENPTTTLNLSGTTVTTVVSVTNVGADVWSYSSRTLTGPARQISSRQVGTLSLVKGDSRLYADGNHVVITRAINSTDWPTDITSWTPKLSIRPSDDLLAVNSAAASLADISGTVVTATGDSRAVRFDLTAAQTGTLAVTSKALYDYDVQLSSGTSRATVETGACYVGDEQTTG